MRTAREAEEQARHGAPTAMATEMDAALREVDELKRQLLASQRLCEHFEMAATSKEDGCPTMLRISGAWSTSYRDAFIPM